jgi:2-polyprenyl-3-methyl-5-hydroxy-6-metoxy-1,4-benzoquinol methylase
MIRREEMRSFSSVSEAEVSKFSELSKDWWDPSKNPLIGMNSIRVEYIINELQQQKQTSSKSTDDFCSAPKLSGLKALDV